MEDVTIFPIIPDFRLERVDNSLHIISNIDRDIRELMIDLYIPIALEIHDGYVIKWEIAPKFKRLLRHLLSDMDSFGPPIINGIHFGLNLILGVPITEQILANDVVIIGSIMKHEEYDAPEINVELEELF